MSDLQKHRFASVQHCSSCGQDHDAIEFWPLRGSLAKGSDGTPWKMWGQCPVTGDPIYMTDEDPPRSHPVLGGEVKK